MFLFLFLANAVSSFITPAVSNIANFAKSAFQAGKEVLMEFMGEKTESKNEFGCED